MSRKSGNGFAKKDMLKQRGVARLADVELIPDLHAMLRQSHILALVPELTDETRNMIGADELAALPQGAIVVNTGRGQVLQLDALAVGGSWRTSPLTPSRSSKTTCHQVVEKLRPTGSRIGCG
jgi:D-isomer specific 2-hydroxyacid dehydrogenase, NAD binding domain